MAHQFFQESIEVKSSTVSSVGYNPELHTLSVQFSNGSLYVYGEVDKKIAVSLIEDDNASKGVIVNRELKGKYPCVRLR